MAGYAVQFTVIDNATKQIDQINRRIEAMRAPMERFAKQSQRFIDVSGLRKIGDGFGWIERQAGFALRTLTAIVPVLGTLTGAATIAGMTKLVSGFAQWGNQLRTNADQIGISTDQLQKWQDATSRAGGSAQDMADTLKNLHNITAEAVTGRNAEALGMFRRFGIDIRDANGHLKTATELLPQVFKVLDSLQDPADRSRVAATLLGDAQAKLYEEYKQSGKPLQDWIAGEEKHQRLTAEQLEQLNRYRLAQASLGTTFDQLGRQVAAVLANNFTPLLQHLDDFVQKHQPEIIAAIDQLSKKFAAWLDNVDWSKVEEGATSLLHGLEFIVNHLDEIAKAAEVVAVIFATKWAFGMVADIAKVVTALGTAGSSVAGAAAGGSGLLGALAGVAGIATALAAVGAVGVGNTRLNKTMEDQAREQGFEKQGGSWWNPFDKIPTFKNQATGETLSYGDMQKRLGYDPKVGMNPFAPNLGRGTPGATPQSLNQLPGDTSWGDYGTRANNPGNMNYASWQNAAGKFSYTDPQTGGAHSMAVYNTMEEGVADTYKLLQRNQERYGKTMAGALHGWAENSYVGSLSQSMGVKPGDQFDIASADPKLVAAMMQQQFRREGRRGSHTATEEQILGGIQLARAPAATPPPGPTQIAGNVQVDITHTNAPPDATVTARGSGNVDVAPPRTVQPQLAFDTT